MFVDTEYEGTGREKFLQNPQPPFTQVAKTCVVVATLGVVVVRDDRNREAERRQQVESIEPVRVRSGLVDFVNGDCADPERECGRT